MIYMSERKKDKYEESDKQYFSDVTTAVIIFMLFVGFLALIISNGKNENTENIEDCLLNRSTMFKSVKCINQSKY